MLRQSKPVADDTAARKSEKKEKKTYTTPLKEKQKRERALKKAEEKITELEQKLDELKTQQSAPENLADYQKLSELQEQIDTLEEELLEQMEIWEDLQN